MKRWAEWIGAGVARGLACLAALILVACDGDGSVCHIQTFGTIPVLNQKGIPLVRGTVNGVPVLFIVDTGATFSLLAPGMVEMLHLRDLHATMPLQGVGGTIMAEAVQADRVGLGSGIAKDVLFLTGERGFGATLPGGPPIAGLFGGDFLSHYDLLLNLPHRMMALYSTSRACETPHPNWPMPYYKVPISYARNNSTAVLVTPALNGHSIELQLDTGASVTLVTREQALAAGVTAAALAADPKGHVRGIGRERTETAMHRFDSFALGDLAYAQPRLEVADVLHGLLGENFLRHHRIWIPHAYHWMLVQPVDAPQFSGGTRMTGGGTDHPMQ